ncbi:non-ribosomal peptide synthetase [Pelagicoccus sp. SDUM812002]|uniref:non-ribosomal peptide synthetase n=1 Tax=Pelagicoccus sp. SDUM812002 TaxID=3041266 RepID=UPI00280D8172|nr:non-ribosomal peptide synthetase [Pelagicoccus sp. SDUM812002]MDQ8185695.1 amino acid adenylation domain-containing protein [Pelagicoccus sp. SDUM812002]
MPETENSGKNSTAELSLAEKKKLLLQRRLGRKIGGNRTSTASLPKRPADEPPAASLGQTRIWFQSDLTDHSASNNITSSFLLRNSVDIDRLQTAVNLVIARHEPLHSTYSWDGDTLLLQEQVNPFSGIEKITARDSKECHALAQEFGRRTFDLEKGPILRMALVSRDDNYSILVLSIHDIAFDKWSLLQFWKEVSQGYNTPDAKLQPLSHSYSDFSYWQKSVLSGEEKAKQLDYWCQKLASPPSPIPLPTDKPYPKIITVEGSLQRLKLPTELAEAVRTFSAENDTSLFVTLLLAFKILLCRYAQVEDVLVSSPVANRRKSETKDLIGFFLNTLVLRSDLQDNPSVSTALTRTKEHVLEALDFQDLPTDAIVESIKPERVAGRHPLFQTMFVFQREDEGTPKLSLEGCEIEPIFVETKTSKFDLSLFVAESGSTFETIVEYRTDLFEEETILRFLTYYRTLLEDLVANPSKRIQHLDFIPQEERNTLVTQAHGAYLEVDERKSICELILGFAQSDPQRIALSDGQTDITYREMGERVNALAKRIVESINPDRNRVGIYMDRSPGAIIAILATLRAGAAYVPIDPSYPETRRAQILEDSRSSLVIADEAYRLGLKSSSGSTTITWTEEGTPSTVLPDIKQEQLAYLIYTSGSTGTPKGVEITHRNLLYSTAARSKVYENSPENFLLLSSLSFDSSVAGIFWTLSTGNTLFPARANHERDLDKIRDIIHSRKISTLLCIPSLYQEILTIDTDKLNSLRDVIVAGEDCPESILSLHQSTLPQAKLHNEYGPTEATVWATHKCLPPSEKITIGSPIPNYNCQVLSKYEQPLPAGLAGELHIGGPGLARGYFEHPSLTAEKFPTLSVGTGETIRFYKTGDRVERTSTGELRFLGRIDEQIKLNGHRIEPREIVAVLRKCHSVKEAFIKLVSVEDRLPQLTAYLAGGAASDSESLEAEARKLISESLPQHFRPSHYVVVNSLPKLPNGKIDVNLLPAPKTIKSSKPENDREPTQTEMELLKIWREILSVEKIPLSESFFNLGGTSLHAIRLFSRIRSTFGRKLSPSRLVEHPSVEALAKLLAPGKLEQGYKYLVPLKPEGTLPPVFLIHSGGLQVLFYRDLAEHIDDRIPLYGLQPDSNSGKEPFLRDIKAMATAYLQEIKNFQPKGPYVLLGHCFGVTIAIEMAKQLQASGDSVPLLVSIDGEAPLDLGSVYPDPPKAFQHYPVVLREARIALRRAKRLAERSVEPLRFRFGSVETRTQLLLKRTADSIRRAFKSYHTDAYQGKVLGFQTIDSENFANHRLEDWKRAAPQISIVNLDCGHWDVISPPFVEDTATKIHEFLSLIPEYKLVASPDPQKTASKLLKNIRPASDLDFADGDSAVALLRISVHAKTLYRTARKLVKLPPSLIAPQALSLAQQAVLTCEHIRKSVFESQNNAISLLREVGIEAQRVESNNHYQFHEFGLKIGYHQIEPTLKVLINEGFYRTDALEQGAWTVYKFNQNQCSLIKRDSHTTRVNLHWDTPFLAKRVPEKLRPRIRDLHAFRAPVPLWPAYYMVRVINMIKSGFGSTSKTAADKWPFLGTPSELIPQLLEFAHIQKTDTLVDIGCGDGRIIIEASKRYGCNCRGVELDADLAKFARRNVQASQVEHLAQIEQSDAGELSYTDASVVFLFLPAKSIPGLVEKLHAQLRPGARIVVHEQEEIQHRMEPTISSPIFGDSGLTVAHLWQVE